jgi:hypothetical protein
MNNRLTENFSEMQGRLLPLGFAIEESETAFFEANKLSFEYDPETLGDLTEEQNLELKMWNVAHLLHQASSGVLLARKFPEAYPELVEDAFRHTSLALSMLEREFQLVDAD